MKKTLYGLLGMLALCLCVAAPARAASQVYDVAYGDVKCRLTDDGTLTFYGNGSLPDRNMSYTPSWDSRGVTVVRLVLAEGITGVGDFSFHGMDRVREVSIADSVERIGYHAFQGCSSLASVTLGRNTRTLGFEAFRGCTSLARVDLANLESFSDGGNGGDTFEGCSSLAYLYIPGTVKDANCALSQCDGLKTLVIGPCADADFENCAAGCANLETVIVEDGGSIANSEQMFIGCGRLKSVILGSSLGTLGREMFNQAYGLKALYLHAGAAFGDGAFKYGPTKPAVCFAGTQAQWEALPRGEDVRFPSGAAVHCGARAVIAGFDADGRLVFAKTPASRWSAAAFDGCARAAVFWLDGNSAPVCAYTELSF